MQQINYMKIKKLILSQEKLDKLPANEVNIFTVDVLRNKEYDETKCNEFPDGFYFSRWELGRKLLTSCDFEEVFPNQGGFKIFD